MELKHDDKAVDPQRTSFDPREKERELFSEFVEWLLSIRNEKDDPKLSGIDNQRRRHAETLLAISIYFKKIDHDEHPELWTSIAGLGVALRDLIEGVTDPLFATKGSKRDSTRIWGARLQAALGLECLFLSGLSRETAASDAARKHKALASLIRGAGQDLKGSLLSWYDGYVKGRVPVPELLEAFQTTRRKLKAANFSPTEYRRRGKRALIQAAKSVRRSRRAGFKQIT
jgi:hypothetical protein